MQDLILLAVNDDDKDLFKDHTEQFFESRELKGAVRILDQNENNLMSFNNALGSRLESHEIDLLNLGETPEKITIQFALKNDE